MRETRADDQQNEPSCGACGAEIEVLPHWAAADFVADPQAVRADDMELRSAVKQ